MVASGPPADLVESFSFAFPAIIICELLGIPAADRHAFRAWTDAIVSTATSTPEQAQDTYLHLAGYLASLFAQRRAQPGNDLLTWLVQARDNDDRLTETELLFLGMALLVGGYETTAHQITNMVYTLLSHDQQLRQLKARPELLPDAVEEMLRFIVFGSAVNPRIATADVKLGAVVVQGRRAGAVLPKLGQPSTSASFPAPGNSTSPATRTRTSPSATGRTTAWAPSWRGWNSRWRWARSCPGSPGLHIAVPENKLTWQAGTMMRGLAAFPVAW